MTTPLQRLRDLLAKRTELPEYPGYLIEPHGAVWSVGSKKYLKPELTDDGYHRIRLMVDGKRINKHAHTLVALAFVGPKPSPTHVVRHINGVKLDNRHENLAWGTVGDNNRDKVLLGETAKGSRIAQAELSEFQVSVIKYLLSLGATSAYCASLYDVTKEAVEMLARGKTWKHVHALVEEVAHERVAR